MKIGDEVYPNMAIETIRVAVGDPSYQVKADDFGVTAMRVPCICNNQYRRKRKNMVTLEQRV